MPIIILHERTIGGDARIATVARADQDLLAHFKPGDQVRFERIDIEEAESLWKSKQETTTFLQQISRSQTGWATFMTSSLRF